MMAGLNAGGVNVLDLEVASVPVTRFLARQPSAVGRRSPSGWSRTTRSRSSSGSSTATASTSPRTASARSSACSTGRTSAGCCPRRSATSASRRGRSSTTRPRSSRPSTSTLIQPSRPKVVVDYGYGSTSFVMPNVLAKLGADVLAVNPYASTSGRARLRPRRARRANVAGLVRASGAHLGAAIDPDGEHLTLIDDEGHVLSAHRGPAGPARARRRPPPRRHASPCRSRVDPARRGRSLAAPRHQGAVHEDRRRRR